MKGSGGHRGGSPLPCRVLLAQAAHERFERAAVQGQAREDDQPNLDVRLACERLESAERGLDVGVGLENHLDLDVPVLARARRPRAEREGLYELRRVAGVDPSRLTIEGFGGVG